MIGDTKDLQKLTLPELRNHARNLGIDKPADFDREAIIQKIEEINNSVTNGGIAYFIQSFCPSENTKDKNKTQVRGSSKSANLFEITGYAFINPRGEGIFITPTMRILPISQQIITKHKLMNGDFLVAKTDNFIIHSVVKKEATVCETDRLRPHRETMLGNHKIKFGQRILVCTSKPFDFTEFIASHTKDLKNTTTIALLLDKKNEDSDFLVSNGCDQVFISDASQHIKSKILVTIMTLFIAKQHAVKNKDVILFVDNWNLLSRLYHTALTKSTELCEPQMSIFAQNDLKKFFLEATQSKRGGSLTIVSHFRRPTNDMEKFIMDDFIDMCDAVIEL
ncbi:MAG: hypothetical protein FWC00_00810 [Firmicutes bacterium]|nr:hypothetical protein [Bacillota bacterium]